MTKKYAILYASAALLLTTATLLAHHSPAAHFNMTDHVEVEGTVVKMEWQNPHIWFYVDVEREDGRVETWGFEGGPPGMLARRGIGKDTLALGTHVTVRGARARDGSNNAVGESVTLADGREAFLAADGRGFLPQFER